MTGQSSQAVLRGWSAAAEPAQAIKEISTAIGSQPLALLCLFLSPEYACPAFAAAATARFPGTLIIGCTTAGEITPAGMRDNSVVAIGFSAAHFSAEAACINPEDAPADLAERVLDLIAAAPDGDHALPYRFAFLLNDGLARHEDHVVSAVSPSLGDIAHFGGSAGDGLEFSQTWLLWEGAFRQNISILTLIRSRLPIKVFRIENFSPGPIRMVVTEADPATRLVSRINDEPAAEEYARLIGYSPDRLSPFIFAAHPVLVQAGGDYHVRAIQKVEENGEIRFFSAVDKGLVLTMAERHDLLKHLDGSLQHLTQGRQVEAMLGFDCVLRKIEVTSAQLVDEMSDLMRRHRVIGFNTYGEQHGAMHVNQTFTGVAIFADKAGDG
ncbi:MAG: FIST N-terminal domain-containing protein [Paracoccus sp. (in: a-proteobacteria)]